MQKLHNVIKDARIKADPFIVFRQFQTRPVIQETYSPVEYPIMVDFSLSFGFFLILGALPLIVAPYSKKPSVESLSPMMSILYFSQKYFGSIL